MNREARVRPHGATLFETWQEYERIAMHFNALLIRLRSQALAAVGGFATIAGVLLKSATIAPRVRWEAMAGVFFALGMLWLAIWILDFTYYHQLLRGAVKALLDLETKSGGELVLSTEIEASVRHGRTYGRTPSPNPDPSGTSPAAPPPNLPRGLKVFYGLVFAILMLATAACIFAVTQTPTAGSSVSAPSAAASLPSTVRAPATRR